MKEIQKFIVSWREVNEVDYDSSKLKEYNFKFRNDFSVFLSSFPPEIKNQFNVL